MISREFALSKWRYIQKLNDLHYMHTVADLINDIYDSIGYCEICEFFHSPTTYGIGTCEMFETDCYKLFTCGSFAKRVELLESKKEENDTTDTVRHDSE